MQPTLSEDTAWAEQRVAVLTPEFNLEQSCFIGTATKNIASYDECANGQERVVADAVSEPLWVCSVENIITKEVQM